MVSREAAGAPPETAGEERPDSELAAAAAAGEAAAFEEIVRRHAGLVLGLGRRLLGSRADAEDLLQDVFLRIHRGLPGFRGEASLSTWIWLHCLSTAGDVRQDTQFV